MEILIESFRSDKRVSFVWTSLLWFRYVENPFISHKHRLSHSLHTFREKKKIFFLACWLFKSEPRLQDVKRNRTSLRQNRKTCISDYCKDKNEAYAWDGAMSYGFLFNVQLNVRWFKHMVQLFDGMCARQLPASHRLLIFSLRFPPLRRWW